jgi:hypothetical protein
LDSPITIRDAVRTIYQTSGSRGFFRGLAPSILRAFPANACSYFVYEGVLRVLGAEKVNNLFFVIILILIHTHSWIDTGLENGCPTYIDAMYRCEIIDLLPHFHFIYLGFLIEV